MIKQIPVNIEGVNFKIQQYTWDQALEIEAEILEILSPVLDVLQNFKSLDEEISFKDLGQTLQKAILSLRNKGVFNFFQKILKNTATEINGQEQLLDSKKKLNTVFHGQTMLAIKLIIEVMKVNNLAFIEGLVGRDSIINMFQTQKKEVKTTTKK